MSEHIPAPKFCITVRVFAWTEKQAEKIKRQVEGMFAGAEVSIVENAPPPVVEAPAVPAAPAAPAAEIAPPVAVPEPPPPRIVPEGSPVQFDQTLLDLNTGAVVTVTDINATSFVWRNDAAEVAENARNGICPFASFESCYEILPDGVPEELPAAEEDAPAATDTAAADEKAHEAEKAKRARRRAALAKAHAAKHAPKAHTKPHKAHK